MNTENMFEQATRMKLRFNIKGTCTTEDLWDLSNSELDLLYSGILSEINKHSIGSLLTEKNSTLDRLRLQASIIKHVFDVKQAESQAHQTEVMNKNRKEEILGIIKAKEAQSLMDKSVEELKAML